MMGTRIVLWHCPVAIFFLVICSVHAAEWSKFKVCSDIGFCRRHRHFTASVTARYRIIPKSLRVSVWRELPALIGTIEAPERPKLLLVVLAFANGVYRIIFDDIEPPTHPRHIVTDVILPHARPVSLSDAVLTMHNSAATLSLPNAPFFLNLKFDPLRVDLLSVGSDIPRVSLNSDDRLLVDVFTPKPTPEPSTPEPQAEEGSSEKSVNDGSQQDDEKNEEDIGEEEKLEEEDEEEDEEDEEGSSRASSTDDIPDETSSCDGCWSESFQSHTDPKLRGPESVGMDISFPFAKHIYGIPERTVNFSIGETVNLTGEALSEPQRLYNLDVFEFELDKPLGLYGSVPLLYARNGKDATGVLWLNSAETYVDVIASETGKKTHWYSESGFVDIFLFAGPSPSEIFKQYIWLTGKPAMPPRFSLGYHQCRWNYRDDEDSRAVDAGFDEHDIPYDVLWLDIEHTDGKRYFTWDTERFPDPTGLQEHIAKRGRKMVVIIDPHIKRDPKYAIHQLGLDKKLYVNKPDGSPYEAWCWPGSSSYFDFTSKRVREEYGGLFCKQKYPHFTEYLHVWNDMNEPSVFNGPEGTMPKDVVHENGIEHRHIHNIYGHYFMQASFEGLRKGHGGNDRPFILSRSFFSGSQRFGAVWTGDNAADWKHLESTVRMLLPLQITGIIFSGADVGGFFGNPSAELLTRWYQVGAFQPFFRGHAHLDTNRREPWLFGDPHSNIMATAIRTRYNFLLYWYSLFAGNALGQEAGFKIHSEGPPMRPLWWDFVSAEDDEESSTNEHQWMVGNALLVAPVMEEGITSHNVYLPRNENWYDLFAPGENGKKVIGNGRVSLDVTLERMVVYQKGGTIVPKQERRRRSTVAMSQDAITLVVALDEDAKAEGELFLDDGQSFNFEQGAFKVRRFSFANNSLKATDASSNGSTFTGHDAVVERIVILGYGASAPKSVNVGNRAIDFEVCKTTQVLTLQRVNVAAGIGQWDIRISR